MPGSGSAKESRRSARSSRVPQVGRDQYACPTMKHPSRLSPSPGAAYAAKRKMCEMGAGTSPHRICRVKPLIELVFRVPCGEYAGDQLEDPGAVVRVMSARPPESGRFGPLERRSRPADPLGSGVCAGVCKGQMSKMQGCRRHARMLGVWRPSADRIPFNWQLPRGGMRGRPPGALRRHQRCRRGVRGAREASREGVEVWQDRVPSRGVRAWRPLRYLAGRAGTLRLPRRAA